MKINNKTQIVEKFLKGAKQADLAEEFNTSRQRINQILLEALGEKALKNIYKKRKEDDLAIILHLMDQDPLLTLEGLSEKSGLGVGVIRKLIRDYELQRDKTKILSEAKINGLQKGRPRLTREYLEELYLNQNLTAGDIALKTGYKIMTVNKWIQEFRLLKRPHAANIKN